jgi:hypothetical protein
VEGVVYHTNSPIQIGGGIYAIDHEDDDAVEVP